MKNECTPTFPQFSSGLQGGAQQHVSVLHYIHVIRSEQDGPTVIDISGLVYILKYSVHFFHSPLCNENKDRCHMMVKHVMRYDIVVPNLTYDTYYIHHERKAV